MFCNVGCAQHEEGGAGLTGQRLNCESDDILEILGRERGLSVTSSLFVDIRDLVKFKGDVFPEAESILFSLNEGKQKFFSEDINFDIKERSYLPYSKNRQVVPLEVFEAETRKKLSRNVFGIEMINCPIVDLDSSEATFQLRSLFSDEEGVRFRKFRVQTRLSDGEVLSVSIDGEDEDLNTTGIQMETSLVQRKVIIRDANGSILKIYPIDVGGFDEGVRNKSGTSLMTPVYNGAYLWRNLVIESRVRPNYFNRRPFLRISHDGDTWSPIGYHIQMSREMSRGFESHGCIRLREKDLYELYYLLTRGYRTKIPARMAYYLESEFDHPMPLRMNSYNTVSRPYRKGKDGLTVMERVYAIPPIEDLLVSPLGGELLLGSQ